MKFEWDIEKACRNKEKHNIEFDEAKTVFNDNLAYIFDDNWNSVGENRELIIGLSDKKRLLIVSFTERNNGVIRIISARLTTNKERKDYEQQRRY
jgi:uncharacterized DUF497 family protein